MKPRRIPKRIPAEGLLRLEVKCEPAADLMGQLLAARSRPRPLSGVIRFNATGAQWRPLEDPPRSGSQGLLEIWLRDSLPQPLVLIANVTRESTEGLVKATLRRLGEAVADLIEKLSFAVTGAMWPACAQPRRSGSETMVTRTRG